MTIEAELLELARNALDLPSREFARQLGVNTRTMRNWLVGKSVPDMAVIARVYDRLMDKRDEIRTACDKLGAYIRQA